MASQRTPLSSTVVRVIGILILILGIVFVLTQFGIPSSASETTISPAHSETPSDLAISADPMQTTGGNSVVQRTPPPPWTVVPRATATFVPDRGVRALTPQALPIQNQLKALNGPFSFFLTSADAKTIAGVSHVGGKDSVATIDRASGQIRFLTEELPQSPQVSGKYVVWEDPGHALAIYDMAQGKLNRLKWTFEFIEHVRVSGNTVVFARTGQNPRYALWGYDLTTQKDFPIVTQPDQYDEMPEISGDWVVYIARAFQAQSRIELRAVNLRTHEQLVLGDGPQPNQNGVIPQLHAIDAPWVVWGTGDFNKASEIHLYNLDTRQSSTVQLPSHSSNQRPIPARNFGISKGVAIFSCGVDCYMGYHTQRKVFFTVPIQQPKTEDDSLINWVISGDQIIWSWHANANGQDVNSIYTSQIIVSPGGTPYP